MYQVYNTVATDDEKMRVLLYSQKSLRRIRPLLWSLSTTLKQPVKEWSTIALNKALRCNTNRTLRSTSRRAVAQFYRAQVQIKSGANKHKPGETESILALNTLLCGFYCLNCPYSSLAKWHNTSAITSKWWTLLCFCFYCYCCLLLAHDPKVLRGTCVQSESSIFCTWVWSGISVKFVSTSPP